MYYEKRWKDFIECIDKRDFINFILRPVEAHILVSGPKWGFFEVKMITELFLKKLVPDKVCTVSLMNSKNVAAYATTSHIAFSRDFIRSGRSSNYCIYDVILHEVAHILVPHEIHGKQWKKTTRQLGGTGEIRLRYRFAQPLYRYTCQCGEIRRVLYRNPNRRRRMYYTHKKCDICKTKLTKEFKPQKY